MPTVVIESFWVWLGRILFLQKVVLYLDQQENTQYGT